MILADENVYRSIIMALRESGMDVYSVYENQRGLTDCEIIGLSLNPPRIILTEDKDFGDLVFAYHQKPTGVILLRYAFAETIKITETLIHFLEERGEGIAGKFVTVTAKKIRIRSLD